MFEQINNWIVKLDELVWGLPLIVFILLVGIFLTLRLRLLQIFQLPRALNYMVKNETDGKGEISSFGALCTALSATIGTGNIVGVATALVAGGPGALFWMWVAAFFGMATKYAEGVLAIKYRHFAEKGHVLGGPFYYIEKGMGIKWKWLAKLFAFFGAAAGLMGIGTITQINGITSVISGFFDKGNVNPITILGHEYSVTVIIAGLLITLCAGMVIIGGIKRISNFAKVVIPLMIVSYLLFVSLILIFNASKLPDAFILIVESAFGMKAVAGGAIGTVIVAMQKGIARGIFSNEAGLGSAPIAAAAAQTSEPVRQGLVSMTGTFIDTIIICSMTGLSIIVTGSWNIGLEGVDVTSNAFQTGLPFYTEVSAFVLMACLVVFAFTTIVGWDYYGERCLEYLVDGKEKPIKVYRWLYIFAVFIGPYLTVDAVWNIADIFNGLMALPNLIALVALSNVVVNETRIFFKKIKG